MKFKLTNSKQEGLNNNASFGRRKTIKGIIIGGILGTIITGGLGVAAVTLTAEQIKYMPSNENFTVTNVQEAMDEIYKIAEYKIPLDTYFYEQGTEGDSSTIVRYKKINNDYFICDQYGKVENDSNSIDVTSKTLIPYTGISAENISAGTAGYVSNSLILGGGLQKIEIQSVTKNFTITVGNSSLNPTVSVDGTFDHILGITYAWACHIDSGSYHGYHFTSASFNPSNNTISFNYMNWGGNNGSWSRNATATIVGYND